MRVKAKRFAKPALALTILTVLLLSNTFQVSAAILPRDYNNTLYSYPAPTVPMVTSTYSGGTPEWFGTRDNYDTVFCQYCHDNSPSSDYTDYGVPPRLRTKINQNLKFKLVSEVQDGANNLRYVGVYHKHWNGVESGAVYYIVEGQYVIERDDTAPPAPTLSVNQAWTNAASVTISWSQTTDKGSPASGYHHTQLYKNSAQEIGIPVGVVNYTVYEEGQIHWQAAAIDNNKNMSAYANGVYTRIDRTAPTGYTSTELVSNPYNTANIYITGADTLSGVAHITMPNGAVVSTTSATYNVTANGTYQFKITDKAGNYSYVSQFVDSIDENPPTGTVTGNPTEWTNQPVTLTYTFWDAKPPAQPTGVKTIKYTTVKGPDWSFQTVTENVNLVGTASGTRTITTQYNGTFNFWEADGANLVWSKSVVVNRIDMIAPWVNIIEDSRDGDKVVLQVLAKDEESGIRWVQDPGGFYHYPDTAGGKTASFKYDITAQGAYTFAVCDVAGNIVTDTYYLKDDIRHDTAVTALTLETIPAKNTDFSVSVEWKNLRHLAQKNVLTEIYIQNGATRTTLYSGRIDIAGTVRNSYQLKMPDIEEGTLYAVIDSDRLDRDSNPLDNSKSIPIKSGGGSGESKYNIKLGVDMQELARRYENFEVSPGQEISIPIVIESQRLADMKTVPVQLSVNDMPVSVSTFTLGGNMSRVAGEVKYTVPGPQNSTANSLGMFKLSLVANSIDVAQESNIDDNKWQTDFSCVVGKETDFIATLSIGDEVYHPVLDGMSKTFRLPITSTGTGKLHLKTVDTRAEFKTITGQVVPNGTHTDEFEFDVTILPGSQDVYEVQVTAHDLLVTNKYFVRFDTDNYEPTVNVTNRVDIDGSIYGKNAVKRSTGIVMYTDTDKFSEDAVLAGKTHGIAIELSVSDNNPDQYLDGYATLDGMNYPIHWNSYEGPTRMKAGNVTRGFIYINASSRKADMKDVVVPVRISDYTDDTTYQSVSTVETSVQLSLDVTPPIITDLGRDNYTTIKYSTEDSFTGMQGVTYRVSNDRGKNWGSVISIPIQGSFVIDTPGTNYIEVQAVDNIFNSATSTFIVSNEGGMVTPGDGSSVYGIKTRSVDFVYINSRMENTGDIPEEIVDAFR